VKKFFRDGWEFGAFTLVIVLPVCGVLLYIVGAGTWDAITHPTWRSAILALPLIYILILGFFLIAVRIRRRSADQNDGAVDG